LRGERGRREPEVTVAIDLSGRVALVTGASRGLGRAHALTLGRAGADVVLVDIQVESDEAPDVDRFGGLAAAAREQGIVYTEATAAELRQLGRRSFAVRCDVSDRQQVDAAFERTVAELGAVDVLVNNAATLDQMARIEDQRDDLWRRDLEVNLTGAFNCARAAWPHMVERGWGRIVNMSSVTGVLGGFGQASYATTKAGLLGLTRTLALEGARHGITCNAVVPGIVGTEAFRLGRPELIDRMVNRTALRREAEPQEIANVVAFLCSELASYVTGAAVPVTGGIDLFTF
jgi:3-oxoacyl-[acyl-carrier protein] reductase